MDFLKILNHVFIMFPDEWNLVGILFNEVYSKLSTKCVYKKVIGFFQVLP